MLRSAVQKVIVHSYGHNLVILLNGSSQNSVVVRIQKLKNRILTAYKTNIAIAALRVQPRRRGR